MIPLTTIMLAVSAVASFLAVDSFLLYLFRIHGDDLEEIPLLSISSMCTIIIISIGDWFLHEDDFELAPTCIRPDLIDPVLARARYQFTWITPSRSTLSRRTSSWSSISSHRTPRRSTPAWMSMPLNRAPTPFTPAPRHCLPSAMTPAFIATSITTPMKQKSRRVSFASPIMRLFRHRSLSLVWDSFKCQESMAWDMESYADISFQG